VVTTPPPVPNWQEALSALQERIKNGPASVLVKGSRGMALDHIVKAVTEQL
jgi:UDP-N-acetylmuramyl pentapeptide synthase